MRASVVIGANYGDEGKGLVTDYLCRASPTDVVVRFNGGAQAGHTVVTRDGKRHVFSHFASGTLAGAATFLSRFFVCNPILFCEETTRLATVCRLPRVYVDPGAMVTTPVDMMLNQATENARGCGRHGSCGVGFGETIERTERGYGLRVHELAQPGKLWDRTSDIVEKWLPQREAELHVKIDRDLLDRVLVQFRGACRNFIGSVFALQARQALRGKSVVFEGAQGLLLDQSGACFPHVTRSNTGVRNAAEIAAEAGIDRLDAIYVTRTYLTRHGAGPLRDECPMPENLVDATNKAHPFQGALRFAPLDWVALLDRVRCDAGSTRGIRIDHSVAVTWADFTPAPKFAWRLLSHGPTADHIIDVSQDLRRGDAYMSGATLTY